MMESRHCDSCACQPAGSLFFTTFNHSAGRLAAAQIVFAFDNVVRAERQGEGLVIKLAGDSEHPVWLYGEDRARFLAEWLSFEAARLYEEK